MKLRYAAAGALAVAFLALGAGSALARVYVPGVKIVFEVRTPQGELRSYQRPGLPPTYWDQSFPARRGDRVTLDALVATGGAELAEVRFSLDGKEIAALTKGPWRTEVNTADLAVGEHPLEVKAKTATPHARETAAKGALVLVAADERTARLPAATEGESERERLSVVIGSLNPDLDRALDDRSAVTLAKPELFFASAGLGVKEFFYTLSREGGVFYTSPLLPVTTYVCLEPEKAPAVAGAKAVVPSETLAGAPLLLPAGEVVLTLQGGDGAGRFGPPVWAAVQVQPEVVRAQEAKP